MASDPDYCVACRASTQSPPHPYDDDLEGAAFVAGFACAVTCIRAGHGLPMCTLHARLLELFDVTFVASPVRVIPVQPKRELAALEIQVADDAFEKLEERRREATKPKKARKR